MGPEIAARNNEPKSPYLQNSDHASLCASSARLVAVVSLSSSATVIGLIHSQPVAGALILSQAAIQFIVTKSAQMGSDFRQPFGPSLSGLKGSQTGFLDPCSSRYSPAKARNNLLTAAIADNQFTWHWPR